MEKAISLSETSATLGVSEPVTRELFSTGQIKAVRVGKRGQ